jgi:copper(I)-binding protein
MKRKAPISADETPIPADEIKNGWISVNHHRLICRTITRLAFVGGDRRFIGGDRHFQRLLAAISLTVAFPALAEVTVSEAWVRGTVPAQKATGAYMKFKSGEDARVVEGKSPVGKIEIHETSMKDGVMQMRALPALELPKGQVVELKPNGYHVMITGLTKALAKGDTVPITFTVEGRDGKRSTVEVRAEVRPLGAAPAHQH